MLFSLYVQFGTNADTDKYIICICARAKKVFLNDRDNLYLGLFEGPVFRSSHHKLSEVLILFIITMCRFYRLFFVFSIFFIFILCYNLYGEYGECIWRWSSWPIS